jgi:hypothetical protein
VGGETLTQAPELLGSLGGRRRADRDVVAEHGRDQRVVRIAVAGGSRKQDFLLLPEMVAPVFAPVREERGAGVGRRAP